MRARLLFSALALAACAGTAHAGLFDDEEARKQIAATTARLEAVQKNLELRLADIEQQSKGQSLDLLRDLDGIKSDLAKIRGQIEVLTYELTEAQKRQKDLYVDIDSRMRKMETAAAAGARLRDRCGRGARGCRSRHAARDGGERRSRCRLARRATRAACRGARPRDCRGAARLRRRARPVQDGRLPGRDQRLPGLREDVSAQPAGAVGAVLGGQCAICATRLSRRRHVAARIDPGLSRQPQGTRMRCSTSHRRNPRWATTRPRVARSRS